MAYVLAKQFMSETKEIQKSSISWWKPQIGDLYCDLNAFGIGNISCILTADELEVIETDKILNYFVPLFQIHQLIKFIEDKTECKIEMDYYEEGVSIYLNSLGKDGLSHYKFGPFENLGFDLLKALWEVACKIVSQN